MGVSPLRHLTQFPLQTGGRVMVTRERAVADAAAGTESFPGPASAAPRPNGSVPSISSTISIWSAIGRRLPVELLSPVGIAVTLAVASGCAGHRGGVVQENSEFSFDDIAALSADETTQSERGEP